MSISGRPGSGDLWRTTGMIYITLRRAVARGAQPRRRSSRLWVGSRNCAAQSSRCQGAGSAGVSQHCAICRRVSLSPSAMPSVCIYSRHSTAGERRHALTMRWLSTCLQTDMTLDKRPIAAQRGRDVERTARYADVLNSACSRDHFYWGLSCGGHRRHVPDRD